MALEIQERHVIVQGTPIVQPTNELFWFGRPQLVLFLIHFTLFQNAFQLAFFFWIWYEYGLNSCFHERFAFIIARVVIGVAVQFLCSYITLPLYALVTQMGSHMKKAIFEEQTANALQRWHQKAKKKNETT
jgi:mlo protein